MDHGGRGRPASRLPCRCVNWAFYELWCCVLSWRRLWEGRKLGLRRWASAVDWGAGDRENRMEPAPGFSGTSQRSRRAAGRGGQAGGGRPGQQLCAWVSSASGKRKCGLGEGRRDPRLSKRSAEPGGYRLLVTYKMGLQGRRRTQGCQGAGRDM